MSPLGAREESQNNDTDTGHKLEQGLSTTEDELEGLPVNTPPAGSNLPQNNIAVIGAACVK